MYKTVKVFDHLSGRWTEMCVSDDVVVVVASPGKPRRIKNPENLQKFRSGGQNENGELENEKEDTRDNPM